MSGPDTPPKGDAEALERDYARWVGVERTRREVLSVWPARALAATLDQDQARLDEGSALPHGWHWIYFNDVVPASRLGTDGHEARGDFLPDVPLPRRMWAGGRIRFQKPLRLGEAAERTSVIERITPKQGRSGALVFVTVRHRITGSSGLCVDEEQEIVYRAPAPRGSGGGGSVTGRPEGAETVGRFRADAVTLFRFSALTFNGHRIHYDHPYATGEEGYPDLVVHGPLLALLLLGAGVARAPAGAGFFEYRALAPLFRGEEFDLLAETAPSSPSDGVRLWATHPSRGPAMEARLR